MRSASVSEGRQDGPQVEVVASRERKVQSRLVVAGGEAENPYVVEDGVYLGVLP